MKTENSTIQFWDKTWARFLKHQGMIAPSGKLIQLLLPHVERNGTVLDLGCGEGRNTIYLSRVGFRAVGLDLSFKGIKVLRNNLFEEEVKALALAGDARQLPFKAGSFSGILAHNLFDHLDKEGFTSGMSEVFRILKKNGVLLMTLDTFPDDGPSKQFMIRDDGAKIFVSGPRKGLLIRSYHEEELRKLPEQGWEILKEELSPRKSKIILLRKISHSS